MTTGEPTPGLRERTRRAVHREIAEAGMALFLDQGFEETTVDQIAEAAGISRRSFFRYFATKEDVVLGDMIERGHRIGAALAARPSGEEPWAAVRAALMALREEASGGPEEELRIGRMLHGTPSLRARSLEKHLAWQEVLVPELARRLREAHGLDGVSADHRAAAIIATALTCIDVATDTWLRVDGAVPLEDLWDEAVAAVRA
ncbi:TetR/AcrR family transcriptional regulator [Nocardiopsis changdeensis]|uniref:TetR family transcriptional regulator n=1 Tax=Nocardiopsis changdeensis TaxID=2831969 RepID=A0ABX8BIR2_9ACTN|nr:MULTISPECIES: TetR/AcrR family transcriptional regulator [Nocardiopsis]QUX20932.1 TetR family transcriptional regulator [Nocardiopsis changdeensis]QYX36863.1 TetR/AcrR family transcriptional regulator [Nocardiopsis sp. MT53]